MKKYRKIAVLAALVIAAASLLCSCSPPNTVSTGTSFNIALITTIYPDASVTDMNLRTYATLMVVNKEGDTPVEPKIETVSGSAWHAVVDQGVTYKYYFPAQVFGSGDKSYFSVFSDAATEQISLAASGGAEKIVLVGDTYANAFTSNIKDKFENVSFVIITVPGSELLDPASRNQKTTVVVLDNNYYGQLFGAAAVLNTDKKIKIGYIGLEGAASNSFIEGLKTGAKDNAEVLTKIVSSVPTDDFIKEKKDNENVDNVFAQDIDSIKDADILIGDELTMSFVAKYCKDNGKKYASIYKDDNAEFCVTLKSDVLHSKLTSIIRNAGGSKVYQFAEGIFKYSGTEDVESNAVRTEISGATYERIEETVSETVSDAVTETAATGSGSETAAESK